MMLGEMRTARCGFCDAEMTTRSDTDRATWLANHIARNHPEQLTVDRRDEAVSEAIERAMKRWEVSPSIDPFGQETIPIRSQDHRDEDNEDVVKRVK